MRRTSATDTVTLSIAEGATGTPGFERAYRELADAREAYDAELGQPDRVPALADAAARLDRARREIRSLQRAA